MKNLPDGWTLGSLNNIVREIVGGGTPPKENKAFFLGDIPFMTVKDMVGRYPVGTVDHITADALSSSSATLVPRDTLIVATRMALGRIVRPTFATAINQDLKALFLHDEISKTYVEHFWRSQASRIEELGTGTTVKGIRLEHIRDLQIPVAPVPEQKRIADKLDLLLARVDVCRERLSLAASTIKRFRQSILSAATSGRLTEGWRASSERSAAADSWRMTFSMLEKKLSAELKGKRREEVLELFSLIQESAELPSGWVSCPVGVVGAVSNGSTPSRADASLWGTGMSWVSSGEVRNNKIYETREQITNAGFASCSVKLLPVGTVLIAMIGEGKTRGQSAILKIPATINQNIAAVVPFDSVLHPEYLWYSFQAAYEANRREGNGTGPQALNCQRVRELRLNLPPLDEQYEIMRRVDELLALADRLEERIVTTESAVSQLTPTLLAKAFRGELVPQDPNDEPASELLKRLAAEREGNGDNAKVARGRKSVQTRLVEEKSAVED